MATIKAGTYTLNETLDFSMLLGDSLIEYNHNGVVSIGDFSLDGGVYFSIHINTDGTITHNDVSWMDGATAYTFYKNGGWTDEKYRTWVFASDYEVDDDVADWFNANLYAPYIEITATSAEGVVLHTKDKLIDNDIKVTFPDGGGSGCGALSAGTDEEMAAFLTAEYEGCTVQYTGETGTYENGRYYMVVAEEV